MSDYTPTTEHVRMKYQDGVSGCGCCVWPDEEDAAQFNRWLAEVIREAKAEERARVMSIIQYRHDDLASCHKDDDCHSLAEGIWLAIDDVKETEKGQQ